MKVIVLVGFAAAAMAGSAIAGDGPGRDRGPGGRGWGWGPGWGPGLNVFVDVPMTGAAAGVQQSPTQDRCREARHSCFGLWGVEEPGYGRCMQSNGC